jgi:hypothetical protein
MIQYFHPQWWKVNVYPPVITWRGDAGAFAVSSKPGGKLGDCERHLLTRVRCYFAFFTTNGRSSINMGPSCSQPITDRLVLTHPWWCLYHVRRVFEWWRGSKAVTLGRGGGEGTVAANMADGEGYGEACGLEGLLRCIFLCEFHPTAGPKTTCQVWTCAFCECYYDSVYLCGIIIDQCYF